MEIILKKGIKRRKSLKTFNALMNMAERYNLSREDKAKVILWMNEEPVKEGDIKGLVEQIMRLAYLFPIEYDHFLISYTKEMLEEEYRESIRSN